MADTGIGGASPVGVFAQGASPYGVLDMAGNVWEWTQSLWGEKIEAPDYPYPYDPADGREDTAAADRVLRVVRGGSFNYDRDFVRCAYRDGDHPASADGLRFSGRGPRPLISGLCPALISGRLWYSVPLRRR